MDELTSVLENMNLTVSEESSILHERLQYFSTRTRISRKYIVQALQQYRRILLYVDDWSQNVTLKSHIDFVLTMDRNDELLPYVVDNIDKDLYFLL